MKKLIGLLIGLILLGAAGPVQAAPRLQESAGEIYIVQADDRLAQLAEKYYEAATAAPLIVEATNTKAEQDQRFAPLRGADPLTIGQRLWLPATHPVAETAAPLPAGVRLEQTLIGSAGENLAFSPDDTLLATGGQAGLIQVWRVAEGRLLWQAADQDTSSFEVDLAFSPGGQRLASVSVFGGDTAILWDAASGEIVAHISHPDWSCCVNALAFSPDGQYLAVAGAKKILIVEANSGQALFDLTYDLNIPTNLAFSPNSQWLAGMFQNSRGPGKLVVWDVTTQEQRTLAEFLVPYSNVLFSPEADWFVAGQPVNRVWQTPTWSEPISLETAQTAPVPVPAAAQAWITHLAVSQNGQRLAGAVSEGVWLWDTATWQVTAKLGQDQVGTIWDLDFSPDGLWVATGFEIGVYPDTAYENEGQLWAVDSGTLVAHLPQPGQIRRVLFSHDSRRLAISGGGQVTLWRIAPSAGGP